MYFFEIGNLLKRKVLKFGLNLKNIYLFFYLQLKQEGIDGRKVD
jgi:hypothetical protein